MTTYLILIGLAVFFVGIAFAGLALKSFFKKDATLTTCSGGTGSCGCQAAGSCDVEADVDKN